MIKDIGQFDNDEQVRGSAVVIGSGLAGVEAAQTLAAHGMDVIVLESGDREFDASVQALNNIRFTGKSHRPLDPDGIYHTYLPAHLRGISRLRQFGGTSNVWTGKWRALQPSDFEARPWLPIRGWPIGFDDLLPHYRACFAAYGIEDLISEVQHPSFEAINASLAQAGLEAAIFFNQRTPARVVARSGDALERTERISVILRATATELVLDNDLERVCAVRCRSLDGRSLTASGEFVVLAAGGLETPRLLLASNRQLPSGIGNQHDGVGRFYIDHIKHQTGRLWPGPMAEKLATRLQLAPRPRSTICFSLNDEVKRSRRLLEHMISLRPQYERPQDRVRRWLSGRSPVRDEMGRIKNYAVKVAFEQTPNRDSRITLGSDRDPLGVPETVVDWRFTTLDHHSVANGCRELIAAFERAGLGKLDFGLDPMSIDAMVDSAHHMGATRMAHEPKEGVVDADCKVFGTSNLFVAGSAVFPTGPIYSPTLTIIALAHRVGEHIATLYKRAQARSITNV